MGILGKKSVFCPIQNNYLLGRAIIMIEWFGFFDGVVAVVVAVAVAVVVATLSANYDFICLTNEKLNQNWSNF